MLLKNIEKEWSLVLKCFFWGGALFNDGGISSQILAPTLKKPLFWISNLDFVIQNSFADEERVL